MYIKRSLIALSLALVATTAHASSPDREGAYVYGGIGKTHLKSKTPAADVVPGEKRKQSDSGTSYASGAGYRFGPFLAAEASFENTLKNSRSKDVSRLTNRSLNVGGLALLPIGDRVEVFGKAAVGSRQQSLAPPKNAVGDTKRIRQSKFGVTPSVGANVYLTEALAVRAEYSIPQSVNKKVTQAAGDEKMRLNTRNVGMSYRF
ncbi:porin family protein [Stenotrophomonas rhizophila]